MFINKNKNLKFYFYLLLLVILVIFFYFIIDRFEKEKKIFLKPISINLLTSVHPNLSWEFKPIKPTIDTKPGEVITVEYFVENLGEKESTGIATFAYFPNQYGKYINKINCFCYDAKTLKGKETDKYIVVMFIDPEATKNSKTKSIKEITIQFTFFDYKDYKKEES